MTSNDSTDPTATPNTVLAHELENPALQPDAKKQKQEVPEEAKPKKSFKAVANLVLAMKRFQSAINPTYEYGKQANAQPLARAVRQTSPVATGHPEKEPHPPTEQYTFTDRGHKATILFGRLPDTPDTQSDQDEK